VPAGPVALGAPHVPERMTGVVVFAHGSGSSRHSPRNRYVASVLNDAGLGTLLFDLLTDRRGARPGQRVRHRPARSPPRRRHRLAAHAARSDGSRIGYFGASTGAAAALWAATEPGADIAAVVSRGGRPDLAAQRLGAVTAPTLLIVGGDDDIVVDLNRQAEAQLRCEHRLAVVPGATHLFEEPGTLQVAAELARDWFITHFTERPRPEG
jgi:putative phosphoribosyl transferase